MSPSPPYSDVDDARTGQGGLVAKESAGDNAAALSVTEISAMLKRVVEDRFGFVRIRGELSGVKRAASGHLYCSLKDEGARIDGVMWKGNTARLSFRPEDGVEVIATGKLTTYPGRSNYQIVIDRMEIAGEGALLAMLAKMRARLEAEGLFDRARKRPLPFLPRVIGVVTSPTGAVIRDILHRLADRFPSHVLVWPVLVQGQGAADQVAAAVRGFSAMREDGPVPKPDLVIVARGGGSIEDLWAFNEEVVVRAIADCSIPVISAVGHETDTTLADFAADLRAPTPTAAAELAVPVREDLLAQLAEAALRNRRAVVRPVMLGRERLDVRVQRLPRPETLLAQRAQRLDDLGERLRRGLADQAAEARGRLQDAAAGLSLPILRSRVDGAGQRLSLQGQKVQDALRHVARIGQSRLDAQAAGLRPQPLLTRISAERQRLGRSGLDPRVLARRFRQSADRLAAMSQMLPLLDPDRPLVAGFARVMNSQRHTLTSQAEARQEAVLVLKFKDDELVVTPTGTRLAAPRKAAGPAATAGAPEQGKLL